MTIRSLTERSGSDAVHRPLRRWAGLIVAAAVAIVGHGCTSVADDVVVSVTTSITGPEIEGSAGTTMPPRTTTTGVAVPDLTTYLVWTSGGLTDYLVEGLEGRFDRLSIVTGDAAPLDVGNGQVVPLDAIGIDVAEHSPFDPDAETAILAPGSIVLGETSARYRGLSAGDEVSFNGDTFEVAGVVSDDIVGAAEVVFSKTDPRSPVSTSRYALLETDLPREELETVIVAMNDSPAPVRIRAEGETRWLRHADGTLPQIFIKTALGEFSYAADSGPDLVQDREFVSASIVTVDLPILGRVTCHRVVVEMLSGALDQLADEGLSDLIDPSGFAGCWSPRLIKTITGAPAGVSRHSWGAAVDINAPANRLGTEGSQDPRLVEIMGDWGFLWGGDWTVPDPMHFEYGIQP